MTNGNGAAHTNRVTAAQLDSFFDRYGWQYEHAEDAEGVWLTGFNEGGAEFDIFIQLSDDWVIFMIYPFTVRPEGAATEEVARRLAAVNYEITMAKTGIDEEGDTFLAVELPAEDFTFNHFRHALDSLSEYAQQYHGELTLLAMGG